MMAFVNNRLQIRRVVKEQVEDVVALVVVGSDDIGVYRHVVGHQGVGDHSFFQSEVLR